MGIYHCFMRTNAQNEREHKVFIVVSGNCRNSNSAQVGMPEPFCGGTSALNNLMCRIISLSVSVQVPRTRGAPGPGPGRARGLLRGAPRWDERLRDICGREPAVAHATCWHPSRQLISQPLSLYSARCHICWVASAQRRCYATGRCADRPSVIC